MSNSNNHKKINKKKEARKLAKNIMKFLKLKGFSQYKLAKEANIGISTINAFLKGDTNQIEWLTLQQIAWALNTTIDSLIAGTEVEIIDNPEHRKIIEAMPPEAKLFFGSTDRIPPENVKVILDMIKLIVKEIDVPAKKRKKGEK